MCPICLDIAKNPKEHECGKVFCQNCIEKWGIALRNGETSLVLTKSGASNNFPDARGETIILYSNFFYTSH